MAVKTCEFCGSTYLESAKQCPNCGKAPIEKNVQIDNTLIEGIPQSEWKSFIGKESDRYIKVFKKNEGKKLFFSLNWSALLFGLNWMYYRKMYKYGIFYLIISTAFYSLASVICTIISQNIATAFMWGTILTLIFDIILRLLGDCIYKKHIMQNLNIHNAGGTSWSYVIFSILFGDILASAVSYGITVAVTALLGLIGLTVINF